MANPYAEFLTRLENAYGLYNPVHKAELAVYLPAKVPVSELEKLYWKLREEYTSAYKTPPDITQINNVLKQDNNLEAEAEWWWNEITLTGNSRDSVLIPDIRAQRSVESFGGWAAFCQRDPDNEHWHHKNFVDAFCKCKDSDTPHVLRGNSNYLKPRPPLLYGDKDKCKTILEYHKNNTAGLIENMTKEMRI